MTVETLFSLLVGALGAALLGLLGAWIQSRREHIRWLRAERLKAYVDVLQVLTRMPEDKEIRATDAEWLRSFSDATAAVEMLGPRRVSREITFLSRTLETHHFVQLQELPVDFKAEMERDAIVARTRFLRAAQKQLGIKD